LYVSIHHPRIVVLISSLLDTYTITLPESLPPTFKGKALKFSYELLVGTCRAGSPGSGPGIGTNSISQVMKVPIRVYNNVSGTCVHKPFNLTSKSILVGRSLKPFDLMWPVNKRMDAGMPGTEAVVVEQVPKGVLNLPQLPSCGYLNLCSLICTMLNIPQQDLHRH